MKRIISIVTAIFCLAACSQPVQKLTFHLTSGSSIDSLFVFVKDTTLKQVQIASAPVVDGIAEFEIPVGKAPRLARIGGRGFVVDFINESGELDFGTTEDHNLFYNGGGYNQKVFGYCQSDEMKSISSRREKASTPEEHRMLNAEFRKLQHQNNNALIASQDPYDQLFGYVMDHIRNEDVLDAADSLKAVIGDSNCDLLALIEACNQSIRTKRIQASLVVGAVLPDFEFKTLSGEKSNVKAVYSANKLTLVDFWASWCRPCRQTMGELKPVYDKYHSKGFEIVSYSIDEIEANWVKASDELQVKWVNCSDDEAGRKLTTDKFAITSIPTLFLVDSEGTIVSKSHSVDELQQLLKKM